MSKKSELLTQAYGKIAEALREVLIPFEELQKENETLKRKLNSSNILLKTAIEKLSIMDDELSELFINNHAVNARCEETGRMREILFRGKEERENGEWIEGFYERYNKTHRIVVEYIVNGACISVPHFVAPETVGQYTGIKDKNGVKIFEGDVVDILTENEEIGVVCWDEAGFIINADGFVLDFQNHLGGSDVSVVGNIYDNPDYLKRRTRRGGSCEKKKNCKQV